MSPEKLVARGSSATAAYQLLRYGFTLSPRSPTMAFA